MAFSECMNFTTEATGIATVFKGKKLYSIRCQIFKSVRKGRVTEDRVWGKKSFYSAFYCVDCQKVFNYIIIIFKVAVAHYVGPLYYWLTERGCRKFWEPKLWGSLGKPKHWKKKFQFFFSINFTQIFRICPKMFQF